MSTEEEFAEYRRIYDDLQQRVARLSLYHHLYEQVRERINDLARQVEDFPGLEELKQELDALENETAVVSAERHCMICGEGFLSHLDELICPNCRED